MVRRHDAATADVDAQLARIRRAIVLISDQILAARADAATTIVSRAEAERTLREQRRALDAAHGQLRAATDTAQRAAVTDPVAAAAYEVAEAGFRSQLAVVEAAQGELATLSQTSAVSTQRSAQVLRRTLQSLDAALREQLALLTRLEHVEQQHAIADLRQRRPHP